MVVNLSRFIHCIGASLLLTVGIFASSMESASGTRSNNYQSLSDPESPIENGMFHCRLSLETLLDPTRVSPGERDEPVVIKFQNLSQDRPNLRILRDVFQSFDDIKGVLSGSEAQVDLDYVFLDGIPISEVNDEIVGNFQSNARKEPIEQDRELRETRSRFSGYKAYLGRRTEGRESSRRVDWDLFFRIVIDWGYENPKHNEQPLLRAVFLLSEVQVDNPTIPERFYRFPPLFKPFKSLTCELADAKRV